MKKYIILITSLILFYLVGVAQASLVTIGTAGYGGSNYNLIWDDDNNGNSIVWLDYTYNYNDWSSQNAWAAALDSDLTINIDTGYSVDWGTNSWRLPNTVDGVYQGGFDGTTTAGYNITTSEMGHLFYEELGNLGKHDTSGNIQPDYGLQNTGDFDNLISEWYWSDTVFAANGYHRWVFLMYNGNQDRYYYSSYGYGLAVRSGQVSAAAPVPEPATMLLLGTGLIGMAGVTRRKIKR